MDGGDAQPDNDGIAEQLVGQWVGTVHMPLHGAGRDSVVFGSPEQGFLHVNHELLQRLRASRPDQ